jgi:tetratricopeptide (TPR) repeat protein
MRICTLSRRWALIGALATAPVGHATADDDLAAQASAYYDEGVTAFRAGEFEAAAERFQLAYNLDPSPELLYNLARAHEEAGNNSAAVLHFRSYLARYPDSEDSDDVRRRMADLAVRMAEETKPPEEAPAPPEEEPPPPEEEPPPPKEAPPPSKEAPPPEAAEKRYRLIGSALVALATDLSADDGSLADSGANGVQRSVSLTEPLKAAAGISAAFDFLVGSNVWIGARLYVTAGQLEDVDGNFSSIGIGPVLRLAIPVSEALQLQLAGFGGVTRLEMKDVEAGVATFEGDGVGFHAGGGAGVLWTVGPVDLHLLAGYQHEQAALALDANVTGSGNSTVDFDKATVSRPFVELGLGWAF